MEQTQPFLSSLNCNGVVYTDVVFYFVSSKCSVHWTQTTTAISTVMNCVMLSMLLVRQAQIIFGIFRHAEVND